jgi:hypothetical protein
MATAGLWCWAALGGLLRCLTSGKPLSSLFFCFSVFYFLFKPDLNYHSVLQDFKYVNPFEVYRDTNVANIRS